MEIQKDISIKSTKKEIFDAYEAVLEQFSQRIKHYTASENAENKEIKSGDILKLEEKIKQKTEELEMEKAINDISNLKIGIQASLNKLSDKLAEEIKKLENIKRLIKTENQNLEDIYKIKNEVNLLLELIEFREQKKSEFEKEVREDEEKLNTEIEQRKRKWLREQDEYEYNLKIDRKKETDDYEFKKQIKEREWGEKTAVREKELKLRETKVLEQENEIKELKTRIESFPKILETKIDEAKKQAAEEARREMKITNDLTGKEIQKEKAISELKISSLEDVIKKQIAQIQSLESQLNAATGKAQELAVKIIEAGKSKSAEKEEIREVAKKES